VKGQISFTAQAELDKHKSSSIFDKAPTFLFTLEKSLISNNYERINRNKINPVDYSLEPRINKEYVAEIIRGEDRLW
jgi:hypothetical protein